MKIAGAGVVNSVVPGAVCSATCTTQWDGGSQKWTQVNTGVAPPERENGGLAFDPIANELVLFGGYAGYYRSDVWSLRSGQWLLHAEALPQQRRRGIRH